MFVCLCTLRQHAPYFVFIPKEKLVFSFAKSSRSHSSAYNATSQYDFNLWCCHPRVRVKLCGKFVEPPDRCRMTITPPSSFFGVSRLWSYNSPCSLSLLGLLSLFVAHTIKNPGHWARCFHWLAFVFCRRLFLQQQHLHDGMSWSSC